MNDPIFRWIIAGLVLGVPGLIHLAMAFYRGNRVERRADFEKHHRCRLPDEEWRRVDRRLSRPDLFTGTVQLVLLPVVATLPWPADSERAWEIAPLVATMAEVTVATAAQAISAGRPLADVLGVAALPRAVTLSDYVPRRLRVVTVASELAAGAIFVASAVAWLHDLHRDLAGLGFAMSGAMALPVACLEWSRHRLATQPDGSSRAENRFLEDALRSEELNRVHQNIVLGAFLVAFVPGAAVTAADPARVGVALSWVAFFLVMPVVIWAARRDGTRFLTRLWGGEALEQFRPAPAVVQESAVETAVET